MTAEYGTTVVDVHSLEDFTTALDNHHSAVTAMLDTIDHELLTTTPALGSFPDATEAKKQYMRVAGQQRNAVHRLKLAIEAAQTATSDILHKYRTTEARNDASAQDIDRAIDAASGSSGLSLSSLNLATFNGQSGLNGLSGRGL